MSSEIFNNINSLPDEDKALIQSFAAELTERNKERIKQQAIRLVDIYKGGEVSTSQAEGPVAPAASVSREIYAGATQYPIDLSYLPEEDRQDYIRQYGAQSNHVEVAETTGYTPPVYPQGFATTKEQSSFKKERKFYRPTRKQWAIGGVATALLVGGAVTTNGYGTGVTIPGIAQDQAGTEASVADAVTVAEPAKAEAAPPPPPEPKLSAADIILGDCLDDNGQGKAVTSATIGVGADQNYKLKTLSGEEVLLTDGTKKPRVELPEVKINVAACILPEARDDAVTVDGNKVKINWDKIDRQLGIVPGSGELGPKVPAWDMDAEPGVTDRATVAALMTAMADSTNQNAAINIVRAEFGKKVIAENEAAIQERLPEALKAEVIAQATKKVPEIEVTVEFTGTPKPLGYKGPVQEPVGAFEVVDVAIRDNDDNPGTPLPVVEFK